MPNQKTTKPTCRHSATSI